LPSPRNVPFRPRLLAAKLVGRWRSGAPLTLAPTHDDPALGADPLRNNDFTDAADPHGRYVPLGSHMRRMNPRDTNMGGGEYFFMPSLSALRWIGGPGLNLAKEDKSVRVSGQ
jgi:deferrochelatase/peroxidase EfeB